MRTEVLLRLNSLISSARIKLAAALALDALGMRHLIIRFDPIIACNLRCRMCFFSSDSWRKTHPAKRFTAKDVERLAGMFFPYALQLHIGCSAEPTLFKEFPSLVELGKKFRVPFIGFTTNAQLLTYENSKALIEAGLDEITISTHGVFRETYESLMPKASYDVLHKNLAGLIAAKNNSKSQTPHIRINYTANPDNLEELAHFFEVFDKYNITTLQIRPIIDFGETDYRNKDLRPHLQTYDEIMEKLSAECHQRKIMFLSNRKNPTYSNVNNTGFIYQYAVQRNVNPYAVWREDFDWQTTDYAAFKRSIGYMRQSLSYVFGAIPHNRVTIAAHKVSF